VLGFAQQEGKRRVEPTWWVLVASEGPDGEQAPAGGGGCPVVPSQLTEKDAVGWAGGWVFFLMGEENRQGRSSLQGQSQSQVHLPLGVVSPNRFSQRDELRPRSLPLPTQNISSYTHHIKSFDACMEH
jgi:hypothetical protein